MILTTFLIAFSVIKCSKLSSSDISLPLLKGHDDNQNSMNHMNVLLQSLYNICPLRKAIFSNNEQSSETAPQTNPLQLVFAKIYYDIENHRGESTEASIYFKDSYLNTIQVPIREGPIDFYSWISRKLFESKKYRKLLQWEILTRKLLSSTTTTSSSSSSSSPSPSLTTTTESEVLIEDEFNFLSIQSDNFKSIQSFLNDFLSLKNEKVIITSDGESEEKLVQINKEILNYPTIATFSIERESESDNESESENNFIFEKFINLNDKIYNLNSFIMISNEKYSVCLKGKDSFWYKIQDDHFEIINEENVINFASKQGYLFFYIDNDYSDTDSTCSPKPSQELIMDSLTKNTIYTLSKTVQKSTNSPSSINGLPIKTKNMSSNQLAFASSISSISPTLRPQPHLTLPLKKPPSTAELAQLESILVPADLSSVKMNLLKTGQEERIEELDNNKKHDVHQEDIFNTQNSFDDYFTLSLKDEKKDVEEEEDDIELEYFKEIVRDQKPSKSPSSWSQFYLNQTPEHQNSEFSRDIFASLLDFEINYHETNVDNSNAFAVDSNMNEDEDEMEIFLNTNLAKIRKSRSKTSKSQDFASNSDDFGSNKLFKQVKKFSLSQLPQTTSSTLPSNGLFHLPPQRSMIPLTASSESFEDDIKPPAKAEDPVDVIKPPTKVEDSVDDKSNIKIFKKQKDIKKINQYSKF